MGNGKLPPGERGDSAPLPHSWGTSVAQGAGWLGDGGTVPTAVKTYPRKTGGEERCLGETRPLPSPHRVLLRGCCATRYFMMLFSFVSSAATADLESWW